MNRREEEERFPKQTKKNIMWLVNFNDDPLCKLINLSELHFYLLAMKSTNSNKNTVIKIYKV